MSFTSASATSKKPSNQLSAVVHACVSLHVPMFDVASIHLLLRSIMAGHACHIAGFVCRVLPLEAISATIERNIRELMSFSYGVQSLVQSQNPMVDAVPTAAEGEDEFGQMTGWCMCHA